jgi:predicted transcriptional regulator
MRSLPDNAQSALLLSCTVYLETNGGGTKTKIMYKAFISYAQLKKHLAMMLANDLLEFDEKTQIYKTTEKGLSFAKLYDQVGQYVSPVQK